MSDHPYVGLVPGENGKNETAYVFWQRVQKRRLEQGLLFEYFFEWAARCSREGIEYIFPVPTATKFLVAVPEAA